MASLDAEPGLECIKGVCAALFWELVEVLGALFVKSVVPFKVQANAVTSSC